MTEYGPLTAFLDYRAASNNGQAGPYNGTTATAAPTFTASNGYTSTDQNAYVDSAWLQLGMLTVGRLGSVYNYGGGWNFDGSNFDEDQTSDQMNLTWAMSGFGMQLGIEDPRDRWGTRPVVQLQHAGHRRQHLMVARQLGCVRSLVATPTTAAGSGFGAQLGTTFKLDQIAKGDTVALEGGVGTERSGWVRCIDGASRGPARLPSTRSPAVRPGRSWQRSSTSGLRPCRRRSPSTM